MLEGKGEEYLFGTPTANTQGVIVLLVLSLKKLPMLAGCTYFITIIRTIRMHARSIRLSPLSTSFIPDSVFLCSQPTSDKPMQPTNLRRFRKMRQEKPASERYHHPISSNRVLQVQNVVISGPPRSRLSASPTQLCFCAHKLCNSE